VEPDTHDEVDIFRAIARSGARVLLIGRRALVALGLPVLTADYDLWVAMDDIEALVASLGVLDMVPNRKPDEARRVGRFVIENGDRIDVMVARACPTVDGVEVRFDDVWARRRPVSLGADVSVFTPSLEDLILTKRFADRERDRADIVMLEALRTEAKR
jgi:hypothetical protein